jgi:hypothetical protein
MASVIHNAYAQKRWMPLEEIVATVRRFSLYWPQSSSASRFTAGAFGFFAFSQSRAGNAAPVGLHLAAQELFWRVVVCVAAKEILMKSYLATSSLGAALVLAATF